MTKGFSNDSSGRTTTPTRTSTRYDGRALQEAPTQALAQPPPAFLKFSMRSSRNSRQSYLVPRSGSRASIDTVCSTTPIRNSTWGPYEPEKGSDSGEDDVLRAINEDLEVLEPFEQDYHRQRPFWLFSMVWAHQIWWIISAAINIPFFVYISGLPSDAARTSFVAQASLINMTITVLVRNELLLAFLYWAFSKIPFRRFYFHRMLHSIGGLHVGCAFGTFTWIVFYAVEVALRTPLRTPLGVALLTTALILPLGITIIVIFALRPLRERFHNAWEYTHRYVGWFVVADLAAHLAIKSATLADPIQMLYTSLPYLTLVCIISIFYIWFTVRRAPVSVQANRSIAVVTFPGVPTLRHGSFARISRDGVQWHAFSVAMTNFEKQEFSLIIGRAGDWTTGLINDSMGARGPEKIYIRGVNPPGFMYMHQSYKKVVTICTGAGIAPALPQIEQATSDIMLIWIAKNHKETYGETVWNAIHSNLPANRIILHDTGISGRPDIGTLIEKAAKAHEAEAVFVVSNDAYTNLCASICWRKGLRCYGATRDS